MSDDQESEEKSKEEPIGVGAKLTNDQQKALFQAIEIVTQNVFSEVAKRFRNYLLVAVSVLTLFGFVTFAGFKANIKEAAVAALKEDPTLRQSIKDDTRDKIAQADPLLADLKQRIKQIDTERTDANVL